MPQVESFVPLQAARYTSSACVTLAQFDAYIKALQVALDPGVASRARKREFVKYFDHFDLLQTAIN
jgi:hypothetical protein